MDQSGEPHDPAPFGALPADTGWQRPGRTPADAVVESATVTPAAEGATQPAPSGAMQWVAPPPMDAWVAPAWTPREPVEAVARRAPVGPPDGRTSRNGGPSVVTAALMAAIFASLFTAGISFFIYRALLPAGDGATAAVQTATTTPATASATPVPNPSPTQRAQVAQTLPPAVTPQPGVSPSGAPLGSPGPTAGASPGGSATTGTGTGATLSLASLVRKVTPSVVTITIQTQNYGRFGSSTGTGSGMIFDSSGWILTSGHVVNGAQSISVTLADGRTFDARLYGSSTTSDVAIIKVEAKNLPAIPIGNSSALLPGDQVVVIGTPLGEYPDSVSSGVVSGLGRQISIRGLGTLSNLIQTDAAINPGNSGGPVLDAKGRVIGIAAATSTDAQGISFAVPIDDAKADMAAALAGKTIP